MGKNKKYAILCAYNGTKYHGCQLNDSVPTVERKLIEVLLEMNLITFDTSEESNSEKEEESDYTEEKAETQLTKYNPNKIGLQRSSRTDKGVHASFNTFIFKSKCDLISKKEEIKNILINFDIYVYKVIRVTKGFLAQRRCESRIYNYFIPKSVFTYEIDQSDNTLLIGIINKCINYFLGTKDYFNFTNLKNTKDTKRFIRRIELTLENDYYKIELEGNSFLYNQIRKMFGYVVQVIREALINYKSEEEIYSYIDDKFRQCFTVRMEILKAPGEYLLLYYQGYSNYNKLHGHLHGKIEVNMDELNEVTDKLIKKTMFTEENIIKFYETIDKFKQLKEKLSKEEINE